MTRKGTFVVMLCCLASFAALPAVADVIYIQPPLDDAGSLICDFSWGQQGADNFVLQPGAATITDVHWWGSYGSDPDPAPDDFTIRFFADVGGSPDAMWFYQVNVGPVTRSLTGMTSSPWAMHDGGPVYEYSVDLPDPLALSAGVTYYLGLMNNTTSSSWGWLEDGPGSLWYRWYDGEDWMYYADRERDLAFALTGPGAIVPEPATFTLMGLGIVSMVGRRVWRQKRR